jgi:CheY-like chemotaxis protein
MAKILVVDDSPTVREMIKGILDADKHEVLMAEDGLKALEVAKKEVPDLIILDLMLPGLDGYRVCRMLKFDKNYKSIPIVMFTSKNAPEDKKLAQDVGADDFMTKDFDPAKLKEIIAKNLTKKP